MASVNSGDADPIPVMLNLFYHYHDTLSIGNKILIEITQVKKRQK